MKSKILFIVPYPYNTAPSQRLKFEQYYSFFRDEGYELTHVSFIDESFWKIVYKPGYFLEKILNTIKGYLKRYLLLFWMGQYDIVYVHLWGTPFGFPVYEWLLRKFSKKLIYDIDDLVYLADHSKNNKLSGVFKSSHKINFLMRTADEVLVSTEKLDEYVQKFHNRIIQIPATIDLTRYPLRIKDVDSTVVIGWTGSHTTSKYLHLLDSVLREISKRHVVKIQVMGDPEFSIDGLDNLELIEWTAEKESENLQRFDIGLHPLPNEDWVYGKSGGKLVQYMAAGVPILASAIGPNFKAVKEGYNGFLIATGDAWISKLELLITDAGLRKEMGLNSRKVAEETYSTKANLNKYLHAFSANR